MTHIPDPIIFTLTDLYQVARERLSGNQEEIVTYRLLRDILRVPPSDPELELVKKAVLKSK